MIKCDNPTLAQLHLTNRALRMFTLANGIAHFQNSETLGRTQLFLALLFYSKVFTKLFKHRPHVLPNSCRILTTISAQTLLKKKYTPKPLSEPLENLLDTTSPTSPAATLIQQYGLQNIDLLHLGIILVERMPEAMRICIKQSMGKNNYDIVRSIAEDNFTEVISRTYSREQQVQSQRNIRTIRTILTRIMPFQQAAIDQICQSLQNFWCYGDNQKPLSLLFVGPPGVGKTRMIDALKKAFTKIKLQQGGTDTVDVTNFVHREVFESSLLGDPPSYRAAQPGFFHNACKKNPRGLVVMENINKGHSNVAPVIISFMNSIAVDKFTSRKIYSRNNVLLSTWTLDENQQQFLADIQKKGRPMSQEALIEALTSAEEYKYCHTMLQTMDAIIPLQPHDEPSMVSIASELLAREQKRLRKWQNCELVVPDEDRFFSLLNQCDSQDSSPRQLVKEIKKVFNAYRKEMIAFQTDETVIDKVVINVDPIPQYLFDIKNRIRRGDYLVYQTESSIDGTVLTLRIKDIEYKQTNKISQQDWLVREFPTEQPVLIGLDEQIEELDRSFDYLVHRDRYKTADGKYLPSPSMGFVLGGPPGCGKTSLGRYMAARSQIAVLSIKCSDLINISRVRELFRVAHQLAPSLVFIDEIDVLGNRENGSYYHSIINEMLQQLQGFEDNPTILVIAATNFPKQLDPALIREGRLGRILNIKLPNKANREIFLNNFIRTYEITISDECRSRFLELTAGYSPAAIKQVLEKSLNDLYYFKSKAAEYAVQQQKQQTSDEHPVEETPSSGSEPRPCVKDFETVLIDILLKDEANQRTNFGFLSSDDETD